MNLTATPAPVEAVEKGLVTVSTAGAIGIGILVLLLAAAAGTFAFLFWRKNKMPVMAEKYALRDYPEVGAVHEQGAREYQEDSYAVSDAAFVKDYGLLAVVSDGMGGLEKGDQVSDTVVTTVINGFNKMQGEGDRILLALLAWANQAVNTLLGPNQFNKSGATLVMGLLKNNEFHYVSVGDSRICLYRDGQLIQLNREHVFRNDLMLRAVNREITFQEAAGHPKASGLTSYLGQGQLKHVDMPAQPVAVKPGDKFILMSDGVYNALSAGEISAALSKNAEEAAEAINAAVQAKNYTNQDNYTAIILDC